MFWRGVLGYLPVNIVQAIAGFGSIVIFTRLLSPEEYGHYALAFSVAAIVHLATLTWVETAMARFYAAEGEVGRADMFATLYRAFAVIALAAPIPVAVGIALAPIAIELKLAIAVGLGSAISRSLLKMAQERRRAAGDVKGYALVDIFQTGGGFALGALLALAGLGAVAPFAGAGAATALCLVWTLGPELKMARDGRFDPQRLKTYATYSVPVSMALVLNVLLASTDRFILAAYTGEAAVGAYHAGYSLSSRTLDILFMWLSMAGVPATIAAFEGGGRETLDRTASQQASLMILIALPAAAGLALVAGPLAHLMVGSELADASARVTPWIAAGSLLSGLSFHYLNQSFTLSRRTTLQFAAIAIPAATNLILCLVLIPRFGLDGAAWATTGSFAVGLLGSYALMRRCLRLPVPWLVLAQAGLATAIMGLAVLQIPSIGGLLELTLKAIVGAIVYAACVLTLDVAGMRSLGLGWLHARNLRPKEAA